MTLIGRSYRIWKISHLTPTFFDVNPPWLSLNLSFKRTYCLWPSKLGNQEHGMDLSTLVASLNAGNSLLLRYFFLMEGTKWTTFGSPSESTIDSAILGWFNLVADLCSNSATSAQAGYRWDVSYTCGASLAIRFHACQMKWSWPLGQAQRQRKQSLLA